MTAFHRRRDLYKRCECPREKCETYARALGVLPPWERLED